MKIRGFSHEGVDFYKIGEIELIKDSLLSLVSGAVFLTLEALYTSSQEDHLMAKSWTVSLCSISHQRLLT